MVAESRKGWPIAAAVASAVSLTGLLGLPAAGVGALVGWLALAAVARDARPDPMAGPINWWNLMLVGLVVWTLGLPFEFVWDLIAGLLETAGAALVLIGSLLGLR